MGNRIGDPRLCLWPQHPEASGDLLPNPPSSDSTEHSHETPDTNTKKLENYSQVTAHCTS